MAIISSRSLLSITDCMFFLCPSRSVVCRNAAAPPVRPSRRALLTRADPTVSPLLRALPLCLPMAGSGIEGHGGQQQVLHQGGSGGERRLRGRQAGASSARGSGGCTVNSAHPRSE